MGTYLGTARKPLSRNQLTVGPLNASEFNGIANVGIFAKWSDKVLCGSMIHLR
jgi:hypothetical protein